MEECVTDSNEKRPFEDVLVETYAPSDPQLSPDGSFLAWVASPYGKEGDHPVADIWLAPTDGSKQGQQFTHGESNDQSPKWSPDGKTIAFLSDRAERGKPGIYLLPVSGGEARQLVKRKSGIQSFAWSHDGKSIAFLSPDEPTEEDERREKERDDPDVYGERWPFARLHVVDVESGEIRTLPAGERHLFDLAWAPEDSRIAFVASPTPELESRTKSEIFTIGISGDEPVSICPANRMVGNLIWASDGNHLVFAAGHEMTTSAQTIHAVEASGGEPRVIGPASTEEACGVGVQPVPGTSRLVLTVACGLHTRLEWVDPANGEREQFFQPDEGDISGESVRVTGDGSPQIAVVHSADIHPPEVKVGTSDSLRQVSDHHADLKEFTFGRQKEFYWTAPDGLELDGVLIHPVGDVQEPYPMIVHIHGGPYGRYSMGWNLHPRANWQQWLAMHGYAVFMPNYRGGMGRGNEFASSLHENITDKEFDDIMSGVDALIERGFADPDRLGIGGWSGGGLLTAWSVGHTHRYKAGIMGAGVSYWGAMAMDTDVYTVLNHYAGDAPWDGVGPHRSKKHSPISYARNVKTPVLIIHGKADARVPVHQAIGFHRALKETEAPSEMVLYPREEHPILERNHQIDMFRRVRDWYQRWV
jgi:dipeptidyl aminopeptidase/acylaminoacyl peptidase